MSEIIQSKHTYKATWRQPEDVDRYLRSRSEGYVTNICAGQSPLGDVQVDIDATHNPDIVADMNDLLFDDSTFDTVIFDPPWKLSYYKRQAPFFEVVRITKPDGLILMNALWVAESENTVIDEPIVLRADDKWANISAIVPHKKQAGQQTLDEAGE